jgi:hypothetical protein
MTALENYAQMEENVTTYLRAMPCNMEMYMI